MIKHFPRQFRQVHIFKRRHRRRGDDKRKSTAVKAIGENVNLNDLYDELLKIRPKWEEKEGRGF